MKRLARRTVVVLLLVACKRDAAVDEVGTIELTQVAHLTGSGDTVDFTNGTRVYPAANGSFVVAPVASTRGAIAAYDASGRLTMVFGREGRGPGEFSVVQGTPTISGIGFGRGDSLVAGDNSQDRMSVFSPAPELTFVRQYHLPTRLYNFTVVTSGLLVSPYLASPTAFGAPLPKRGEPFRMVGVPARLYGWDGKMVAEFGHLVQDGHEDIFHTVALADADHIWSGNSRRYEIDLLTRNGDAVRHLVRDVPWFPPDTTRPDWVFLKPPPTRIQQVSVGSDGNLWVLISRASRNWANHPPVKAPPLRPGMPIQMLPAITMTDYYEDVLEVLDPVSGKLLATRELTGDYSGFIAPQLMLQKPEDSTGVVSATIWKAVLKRP